MYTRKYLQQKGFEVKEFEGGTYDPYSVIPAGMMVMVGYELPGEHTNSTHPDITVGKGQYEQLQMRVENHMSDNFYVVGFTTDGKRTPILRRYVIKYVLDSNSWSKGYGLLGSISLSCLQPRSFDMLLNNYYEPIKSLNKTLVEEVMETQGIGINDYLGIKDEPVKFHIACIKLLKK
jgi:hypothetical protein